MKHISIIVGIVVIGMMLGAGCTLSRQSAQVSDAPLVAVTIFPLYDIARTIAGDEVDVQMIVPPGGSPHTFEPTPSTIRELQRASLFFHIGYGIDDWIARITESVPSARIVTVDRNIALRAHEDEHDDDDHDEDEHNDDEDEHGHGSIDPHYWLSPTNAVHIAYTIADELSLIVPLHAELFVARADAFADVMREKDNEWQSRILTLPERDIMTFHDAFMYFADHFDLHVVATFEPFPGREPSPRYLQHLQTTIEEHGIRTVFMEPNFPRQSIESFARDNRLTLGVLDTMEGASGDLGYIDLMEANVSAVIEALSVR